ncbi:hypothetical protein [Bradyrhizobium japonicum]|uniref:hypothetical protein n=1 Tax=Bradyrhizobium japonicum TaxID=375 RepID=UPI0012BC7972|nr:hypothetical protein [Bradyrhizobium japonicum]
MTWLIGLVIALIPFLMLTSARVTAAELFSVRCEGGAPVRPYFATFDLDAKAVVFETPPIDVETNFGIICIRESRAMQRDLAPSCSARKYRLEQS